MSVPTKATRRNIPEDGILNIVNFFMYEVALFIVSHIKILLQIKTARCHENLSWFYRTVVFNVSHAKISFGVCILGGGGVGGVIRAIFRVRHRRPRR
jgi:hypothetical protein